MTQDASFLSSSSDGRSDSSAAGKVLADDDWNAWNGRACPLDSSKDSWNPLLFVTRSFQKIARTSQALFGAMQLARTFYFLGGN